MFGYVRNNPFSYFDLLGLYPVPVAMDYDIAQRYGVAWVPRDIVALYDAADANSQTWQTMVFDLDSSIIDANAATIAARLQKLTLQNQLNANPNGDLTTSDKIAVAGAAAQGAAQGAAAEIDGALPLPFDILAAMGAYDPDDPNMQFSQEMGTIAAISWGASAALGFEHCPRETTIDNKHKGCYYSI